jgi:hypothetical protein
MRMPIFPNPSKQPGLLLSNFHSLEVTNVNKPDTINGHLIVKDQVALMDTGWHSHKAALAEWTKL